MLGTGQGLHISCHNCILRVKSEVARVQQGLRKPTMRRLCRVQGLNPGIPCVPFSITSHNAPLGSAETRLATLLTGNVGRKFPKGQAEEPTPCAKYEAPVFLCSSVSLDRGRFGAPHVSGERPLKRSAPKEQLAQDGRGEGAEGPSKAFYVRRTHPFRLGSGVALWLLVMSF